MIPSHAGRSPGQGTGSCNRSEIAEAGLPGYEAGAWYGLMVPTGTPQAVVDRLQKAIGLVRSPESFAQITKLGAEPVVSTAAQLKTRLDAEVTSVDDELGALVRLMQDVELMDSTIFVFCADHGEMMGERGMWFKQTFFEHSSRVPLIICGPGLPNGKIVDKNVSLVDLTPTLLSAADDGRVDTLMPVDGTDLSQLMTGTGDGWSDRVFSEYSDMGVCSPCRMIREGRYKYSYTHGHESLLFDLVADPAERKNLCGRPEVAAIEKRLHAALLEGWDPDVMTARILASQAARKVI